MPGPYDLNLRELMKRGAPALLRELGYPFIPKEYHLEKPGPGGRAMDYVAFTPEKIFHLEFQTIPDADMPLRMIEYCTDILRHPDPDNPRWQEYLRDDHILQTVLHFRRPDTKYQVIESKRDRLRWLYHRYNNIFAESLNSSNLLNGSDSDAVLSIFGDKRRDKNHVQSVIKKIRRRDLDYRVSQFYMFMLSGLGAMIWSKDFIREINEMPILADVTDNPHLKGFFDQNEKATLIKSLLRRLDIIELEDREWLEPKLKEMDLSDLEDIDERSGKLDYSIEDVLGFDLPSAASYGP